MVPEEHLNLQALAEAAPEVLEMLDQVQVPFLLLSKVMPEVEVEMVV
jgi:hypothetical protein